MFAVSPTRFDEHREDDHIDFYYERNIPQSLSRQGPRAAVADVNGDGLEDVYIGGAAGQPGQLYLRSGDGFRKKEQEVFISREKPGAVRGSIFYQDRFC